MEADINSGIVRTVTKTAGIISLCIEDQVGNFSHLQLPNSDRSKRIWIGDRIEQEQEHVFWIPAKENMVQSRQKLSKR